MVPQSIKEELRSILIKNTGRPGIIKSLFIWRDYEMDNPEVKYTTLQDKVNQLKELRG